VHRDPHLSFNIKVCSESPQYVQRRTVKCEFLHRGIICVSAWWRWQHKYVQPKRSGVAPFFQVVTGAMAFFYLINYGKMSKYGFYSVL